ELWAAKPKQARKTPGNKDWLKAEDVFDQGREYDWSGEPKKAMQMYRRALDIHPGYVDAHVHIGLKRGQWTETGTGEKWLFLAEVAVHL
ncbi:MAG: hypothetical protein R6V55_09235, partial [Desulfovermiculus sp.]